MLIVYSIKTQVADLCRGSLDDFLSLSYQNHHRDLLDSPIESILRSRYSRKMWVSESIASPYLRTMVLRLTRKSPAASPCVPPRPPLHVFNRRKLSTPSRCPMQ